MAQQGEALTGREEFARHVAELAVQGADAVPSLVDLVVTTGIGLQASDVHLEPGADGMAVRMRLDGVMQTFGSLPAGLARNLVSRCKVTAGLLTYRTDIPQEGAACGQPYPGGIELRISTFPTLHGERVAIRVFHRAARRRGLEDLGLVEPVRRVLERALAAPEGLVLLSGPSGSGKTTTLYASLDHILNSSQGRRSVVTVEDPIENEIGGVTQTQVRPAVGLTFASGLRSLLRQDPEVIMVGEVRDAETAHIVVEAALTGHLVLSTVHAPRAAVVPHRLLDMGVEPYGLAGALSLVLAQRLLRRLCPACSRPAGAEEPGEAAESARAGERVAAGCAQCHGTGYRGRVLVAEALCASEALHDAIMDRAARRRFLEIAASSGEDLQSAAWHLVEQGLTSVQEVRRVLGGGIP